MWSQMILEVEARKQIIAQDERCQLFDVSENFPKNFVNYELKPESVGKFHYSPAHIFQQIVRQIDFFKVVVGLKHVLMQLF